MYISIKAPTIKPENNSIVGGNPPTLSAEYIIPIIPNIIVKTIIIPLLHTGIMLIILQKVILLLFLVLQTTIFAKTA